MATTKYQALIWDCPCVWSCCKTQIPVKKNCTPQSELWKLLLLVKQRCRCAFSDLSPSNGLSVRGVQGTTCTRKCIVFFWFIFAGGSLVYTDIGKQCTKFVRNRACQQQAQTSCISNAKTSLNKSYDYFCQYFPIIYLLEKKHCDDKANFCETMHDTIIAGRLRSSITISKNQFSSLTAIRFSQDELWEFSSVLHPDNIP